MLIIIKTFRQAKNTQSGFSLLESLIAILVMALGLLGILGMQVRTLTNTQNSLYRTQAIRLIEDLSERLLLNPNSLITHTAYLENNRNIATECKTTTCYAQRDANAWRASVANTLPAGQAIVFLAEAENNNQNHRQLGVMLAWRANETFDTDKYIQPLSNLVGAGDQSCPDNLTCHLQFIPLKARCAPHSASGSNVFYCE